MLLLPRTYGFGVPHREGLQVVRVRPADTSLLLLHLANLLGLLLAHPLELVVQPHELLILRMYRIASLNNDLFLACFELLFILKFLEYDLECAYLFDE